MLEVSVENIIFTVAPVNDPWFDNVVYGAQKNQPYSLQLNVIDRDNSDSDLTIEVIELQNG